MANGTGRTAGRLGDLHALGTGQLALTYAFVPTHFGTDTTGNFTTKNHVEFALLDANGVPTFRRKVYEPEGRVATNTVIFFETETWDGQGTFASNQSPQYKFAGMKMMQVDAPGNVVQGPAPLPMRIHSTAATSSRRWATAPSRGRTPELARCCCT